jgi:pimeloyl-ACP methyl ester carboxylesterase
MPKVFVHGNPETSALWRPLLEELESRGIGDLHAVSPPGFGAPVAGSFEPTQIGYRDWLIAELESLGGDIDLVGHDWGAGHVYGVLAERPDLLRSWAADCAGLVHRDYIWHDGAQAWQTPEVGEQAIEAMFGAPLEQRVATFEALGIRTDIAREIAGEQNDTMGRCVLALYRSAAQPALQALGARLRTTERRPGLVLIATEDPYAGTPEMAVSVAEDLGATPVRLEGQGHWWMFGGAATAADALATHWKP